MLRRSRAFQPGAFSLESRIVLSTLTWRSAAPAEIAATPTPTPTVSATATDAAKALTSFATRGRYLAASMDNRPADAPLQITVNNVGNIRGLGRVTAQGSLDFGGFRMPGPDITGTVNLVTSQGTLTLDLSGTGGNGRVANNRFTLSATVVGGTGAYANVSGVGNVIAQFGANTNARNSSQPIAGNVNFSWNIPLK